MPGPLLLVNKGRRRIHHRSYIGNRFRNPPYYGGGVDRGGYFSEYHKPVTRSGRAVRKSPRPKPEVRSRKMVRKSSVSKYKKRKTAFRTRRRSAGGYQFYQTRGGIWRLMPTRRFISRRSKVAKKRKYKRRALRARRKFTKAARGYRRRQVRKSYRRDDNPRPVRRRRRYFRKYRRDDNPWFESPHPGRRHRAAGKKGWKYRRRGIRWYKGKRIPLRSKWTGKIYRRPKGYSKKRHHFPIWKNPMMLGETGIIAPLALAALGFIGSSAIITNLPSSIKDKMVVGGYNLAPVAIPLAVGLGLMFLAPKVKFLQPYTKHLFFAAIGFGVAGAVAGIGQAVKGTEFGKKIGVSGYVKRPLLSGYVKRPALSGYTVSRTMGQVNTQLSVPTFESAGAPLPAIKPYGVGLPTESRRYNEFDFGGVYGRSIYER